MAFLDGLFETKASVRDEFPRGRARSARTMTATHSGGFGFPKYELTWNLDRIVRDGLERSIWVFRSVDAIATNGAKLPAQMRKGDPEHGEVFEPTAREDLRLMFLLNRRPNPYETARQFKYRLLTQFMLSKKGVFVEVIGTRGGGPAAFYLLPPDRTSPIPHETRFVSGFRLQHANGGWTDLSPERVIWIRKPHPIDPYAGLTPAEAAGIEIDSDFYMRLFNRNFMANDGRPGGIVSVKGEMAEDVRTELYSRFNNPDRSGRVSVVEADNVTYQDLATTPREAQFVESRKHSKEDLLLAFGVPESVLGNSAGRCVDDQTECLTQRGWVGGRDLTEDDTILSMDPADGRLKWGPVHEVYRNYAYDGPMHRLRHKHADYLVTPGHKWAVVPRAGQGRKNWTPDAHAELKKVEDLARADRVIVMGDAENAVTEPVYTSAFVELVGWHVTEGSVDSPSYIRICQNEGEDADRIRDCLKESGALWHDGHKTDAAHQRIFYVRGEVAAAVNAVAPGKVMSHEFINSLTATQRELLMRTMIDADGSYNRGNTAIFTQKSREMAEAFVYVATLAGYKTSMRYEEYGRDDVSPTNFGDVKRWRVIISERKITTFQRPGDHTLESYRGLIWCPRTNYGTMVARRDGRVFVTGQTFDNADAEEETFWRHTMKSTLSFVYEGFDRLSEGGDTDDIFIGANYDGVNVLQRDERERAARAQTEWDKGLITDDEYRIATGKEPFDRPGARVLWVTGQGKIPIARSDEDEKAAIELLQAANPQPAQGEGDGETVPPPGKTPATRSEPPKLRAVKSLVAPGGSGPNGELLPEDLTETEKALFQNGRTAEDIAESRRAAAG